MNKASPMLEMRDVRKSYDAHFTLEVPQLALNQGELVTILGASGCGKTTLLRLLAGMEKPDAGTIHIAGENATDLPLERRPVNMVFQSYALFPHLDVLGNISFGLRATGKPIDEIEAKCKNILELTELTGLEKRMPNKLSGGQQQRVALARALVMQPRALLLDEPLAALDANLREQMRDYLVDLQASTKITFVLVTHDHAEALAISHRIFLLDDGKITQAGKPRELYQRPNSLASARALGRLTTAPAKVNGNGAMHSPAFGDILAPDGVTSGEVTLALRPENLRLKPGHAPDEKRVTLKVERQEYLGNVSLVSARAPDGSKLTAQLDQSSQFDDEHCYADWDSNDLLIYGSDGQLI